MVQGILGKKLGMTQIFAEDGNAVPVTVIEAGPCYVTQVKTVETDGYEAVQLGFGAAKHLTAPERGHLKGQTPLKYLREFSADDISAVEVGQQFDVSLFEEGETVDVIGTSKGKGFAGVVKRHHFRGGPKTHGQSDRMRSPGSSGSTTTPGRVLKGTRRAGRMGGERVTVKNLEVVRVDGERNLILVRGAVPGPKNGLLIVHKVQPPA
jgi:large subunit ribosomal protein L3